LNHEAHEEHEGVQQDAQASACTRPVSEFSVKPAFKDLSFFVFFFVTFVWLVVNSSF